MASSDMQGRVLRFGVFEVDPEAGELRKQGESCRIQQLPFRLLAMLLERPGEIVTRRQLRETLWQADTFVDFEHGINTALKKLREVLNDDAHQPRFIETIPRRGYRFIAPVECLRRATDNKVAVGTVIGGEEPAVLLEHPVPKQIPSVLYGWPKAILLLVAAGLIALVAAHGRRHPRESMTMAAVPIRSVAVLPFDNLSGDPRQEYLADGITDELITELAEVPSLHVISRTSVTRYKGQSNPMAQLQKELGVDAVVEGSVVRDGDKVRVDARLFDIPNGRSIWAQRFETAPGEVVGLEDNLVRSVAERVLMILRPDQRTQFVRAHLVNNAAYEAYLHGLFSLHERTMEGLQKSVEFFGQAARLDPNFAPAYAGMAHSYSLLADYGIETDQKVQPKAEIAARRAIQLDPSLGSAHAALAFVLWHYEWKWQSAEAEFQRALALDPNNANVHHWYALFLASKGNFAAADAQIQQARALDPLSSIIRTNEGWIKYYQGDLTGAVSYYRKALQSDPSFLPARQKLWIAYTLQGNQAAALQELDAVLSALAPAPRSQVAPPKPPLQFQTAVEQYLHLPGCDPYERARVLSIMGRRHEALLSLEKAERERRSWTVYIGVEPAFTTLRSSSQFARLQARVGLPPGYSRP